MPQTKPPEMSAYGFFPPLEPIDPVVIDMQKLDELAVDAEHGNMVRRLFLAMPPDPSPAVLSAMWVTTLRACLPKLRWKERYVSRKAIQTSPSEHAELRHCARVVTMVHELHKVGYQRIRAIPQESPSGAYWRCNITFADNVLGDGVTLLDFDIDGTGKVAHYTSGQGSSYFGWADGPPMTAREMAVAFLERFPMIAQNGQGRDWLYAG